MRLDRRPARGGGGCRDALEPGLADHRDVAAIEMHHARDDAPRVGQDNQVAAPGSSG
jgi:hypothetical protein